MLCMKSKVAAKNFFRFYQVRSKIFPHSSVLHALIKKVRDIDSDMYVKIKPKLK